MYQRQNFRGQNNRGGQRANYRNENYERGGSRSRERSHPDNIRRNDRSSSNTRLRSQSRASTNRGRFRCYRCKEYDHFTKIVLQQLEKKDRQNKYSKSLI